MSLRARAFSFANAGLSAAIATIVLLGCSRSTLPIDEVDWTQIDGGVPARSSSTTHLAVGAEHACAIAVDQRVWCWGNNHAGELGDGTRVSRPKPAPVVDLTNIVEIAAGPAFDLGGEKAGPRGSHTCARNSGREVFCWGANIDGSENGVDNLFAAARDRPVKIAVPPAVQLAPHVYLNCVLGADSTVWCWGRSLKGGAGRVGLVIAPERISDLPPASNVVVGWDHACALLLDGGVACWGDNTYGQLGDGTTASRSQPARVRNLPPVRSLASGNSNACAITMDGDVFCWGILLFPTSDTKIIRALPQRMEGFASPKSLSMDTLSTWAIDDGADVVCSGYCRVDAYEPDCVRVGSLVPRPYLGIGNATEVVVRDHFFGCVRNVDESIACFGQNFVGQLGDGTRKSHCKPAPIDW